jgi:hypothetical protein
MVLGHAVNAQAAVDILLYGFQQGGLHLVAIPPAFLALEKVFHAILAERLRITLYILAMLSKGIAQFANTAQVIHYKASQNKTVTVSVILAVAIYRIAVMKVIHITVLGAKATKRVDHSGFAGKKGQLNLHSCMVLLQIYDFFVLPIQ